MKSSSVFGIVLAIYAVGSIFSLMRDCFVPTPINSIDMRFDHYDVSSWKEVTSKIVPGYNHITIRTPSTISYITYVRPEVLQPTLGDESSACEYPFPYITIFPLCAVSVYVHGSCEYRYATRDIGEW